MRNAFSLIELSIVLVILGLLTGGILSGQSLIRAAAMRTVTEDFRRYSTATFTFRDKYFGLPGDLANATKFWGAQAGSTTSTGRDTTCSALDETSPSTDGKTCNGTGDGKIGVTPDQYEMHRYWQQLANAGLIEGKYSGVQGFSGLISSGNPGVNVPAGRINSSMYMVKFFSDAGPSASQAFAGSYGNVMTFGGSNGSSNSDGDNTIFKPEEAWNIDVKLDDGKPGIGKVRMLKNASRPNCVDSDDPATAVYKLDYTGLACHAIYLPGF